ncbi:hypothetical protein Q3C01_06960 [Bradyrhizobium sp. UFLA05-109]
MEVGTKTLLKAWDDGWAVCELLWSLTPRKGMRDRTSGITAKFLHIAARKDKSQGCARRKRDSAGKPFHKLPIISHKSLKMDELSAFAGTAADMLMDVYKLPQNA